MRTIVFDTNNRSGNLLHIEVPGAIVNIRVNRVSPDGHEMTVIEIKCDDYADDTWRVEDKEKRIKYVNVAVVKQPNDWVIIRKQDGDEIWKSVESGLSEHQAQEKLQEYHKDKEWRYSMLPKKWADLMTTNVWTNDMCYECLNTENIKTDDDGWASCPNCGERW